MPQLPAPYYQQYAAQQAAAMYNPYSSVGSMGPPGYSYQPVVYSSAESYFKSAQANPATAAPRAPGTSAATASRVSSAPAPGAPQNGYGATSTASASAAASYHYPQSGASSRYEPQNGRLPSSGPGAAAASYP